MKKTIPFVYVAVLAGASIVVGGCSHTQLASVRDAVNTVHRVYDVIEQIEGMRDAYKRFERMR
jgi:hypothetical protein